MRKLAPFILFSTVAALLAPTAPAEVVYRQGEGFSTRAPGSEDTAESSASAQYAKGENLESNGDLKSAVSAYSLLVRKFPNALIVPKAQLKIAQVSEKLADYEAAFVAYGKYLSKYPQGTDFDAAVAGQFNIAKRFLEGERRKVLGVKTFGSIDRAREMFAELIKNAPYSKYAPLAQFNVGLALEKQTKASDAVNAYKTLIEKYPGDPLAADAQYQIGYVYLTQRREGTYDPRISENAREGFEDFIANYPNHEKIPQAQANLQALTGKDTRSTTEIAKFYDKTKNYKAAVIYYNEVVREAPESGDAQLAKNRIAALRTQIGDDALRPGPEKAETGARASARRKMQAQVDTASRPDFNGPPVEMPEEAPAPKPRTTSPDPGPVPAVEPTLPQQ